MGYSVTILSSFEIQNLTIIITNTLIKFLSWVVYEIFYNTLLFSFPDNYQMLRCSYSFSILIHIKSQNITCSNVNCTYNQCKENPSIFLTKIVVLLFVHLTSFCFWQLLFISSCMNLLSMFISFLLRDISRNSFFIFNVYTESVQESVA